MEVEFQFAPHQSIYCDKEHYKVLLLYNLAPRQRLIRITEVSSDNIDRRESLRALDDTFNVPTWYGRCLVH